MELIINDINMICVTVYEYDGLLEYDMVTINVYIIYSYNLLRPKLSCVLNIG